MAVNQQAIDQIKLDEAFTTGTYMPFNECWTVRMDSELMVIVKRMHTVIVLNKCARLLIRQPAN